MVRHPEGSGSGLRHPPMLQSEGSGSGPRPAAMFQERRRCLTPILSGPSRKFARRSDIDADRRNPL